VQDAIVSYSQFAIAPQTLSVTEACQLEPLLNPEAISGAMTVKHGHVHPEMTANAYIQAFIRAGGVRQIEEVTGLIQQNQQVRGITTNRQKYSSANVVVCAGAYSRALLKAAGMPVKLYFTHTELIEIPAVDLQMRWLRPPAQRFRGKLPPKSLLLLAASQVMQALMKWFDLEAESSTPAKEQLWDESECEISPPIIDAGAIQFIGRTVCVVKDIENAQIPGVMAKNLFHNVVRNALVKDGWQITNDPFFVKVGGVEFFIDLGAEKLLAAERNGEKIAVEIKSFINTSSIADFHLAVGQFINYRVALKLTDPERKLLLAVPDIAYRTFFQKEFPRTVIQEYQLDLFVYDIENEVIVSWQI